MADDKKKDFKKDKPKSSGRDFTGWIIVILLIMAALNKSGLTKYFPSTSTSTPSYVPASPIDYATSTSSDKPTIIIGQ